MTRALILQDDETEASEPALSINCIRSLDRWAMDARSYGAFDAANMLAELSYMTRSGYWQRGAFPILHGFPITIGGD